MGDWLDWMGQNTGKRIEPPEELPAPPEAKGIDDPSVIKAKKASFLTESLGQTRQSTFLTGARGTKGA